MQNTKLSILATICLLGLSILAGCQKSSVVRAAAAETPQVAPEPMLVTLGIDPQGKGTSDPTSVTLYKGKGDRIIWSNPAKNKNTIEVIFDKKQHSPFEGQPAVPADTFVVYPGRAVPSGAIKSGFGPTPSQNEVTYHYTVAVLTEMGALRTIKDGDIHIKH